MQGHNLWEFTYSKILLPSLLMGARISALKNQKTRETLAGQEGLWARIAEQLKSRDETKSLLWFHVASAGEYLQAMPVMERFMAAGYQCALTITSVSGYTWANKRREQYPDLVLVDFMPLDTKTNIRRLLDQMKPKALVLVKFDLWPNAIWESRKKHIPVFLISATLQMKSKRVTSSLARSLYHNLYSCIDSIFTVSEDDSQRFLATCPEHPHVVCVGDTRFDSVLDRKKHISPPALPAFIKEKTVLVIGSAWPADEIHIFPAIVAALKTNPEFFVIVAPHETDSEHLASIRDTLSEFGIQRFSRLSESESTHFRVLLVDTVGHLSSLYTYADLAYVGGAFGKGVHNVMEPSAMGAPTIVGPFYQNSPEAMDLIEKGKCFSINDQQDFGQLLSRLLGNPKERMQLGKEAAQYIEEQAGASDTCFKIIEDAIK